MTDGTEMIGNVLALAITAKIAESALGTANKVSQQNTKPIKKHRSHIQHVGFL